MVGMGRLLLFLGMILVVVGILFMYGHRIPWLGQLPGDVYIETDNVNIYFPLTSSVLVSLLFSLLLGWLLRF